jgi:hypothetical protein
MTNDPDPVMDALKAAHHALTALSGLWAYDVPPGPSESFRIDESATLRLLESVLPPAPWDVPGTNARYLGREE